MTFRAIAGASSHFLSASAPQVEKIAGRSSRKGGVASATGIESETGVMPAVG